MEIPETREKRILIVGAGCSGLAAIKCCLDEGLTPVCLEKSSDIGGLWNFSQNPTQDAASIYNSLVINTSKDMMMFSDFPPPDDFPLFLTHKKVLEYFKLYTENFDLLRYITFNTEVRNIAKSPCYDETGRWQVRYAVKVEATAASTRGGKTGEERDVNTETGDVNKETIDDNTETSDVNTETVDVFDGVMICSGHHSVPHVPDIPGLSQFEGTVLHSRSYKDATPFAGQRVVILGMGNSAVDIACDLARSASQVYLSSRRGAWIVPRTAFWGLPADMLANSRVVFTMPLRLLDWCVQKQANFRIDHDTYGLRPDHGVLNCHPTINDELPVHLVSGRVQARPRLFRVEQDGVWFDDETFCQCDVIIMATGYDYRADFVNPEIFKIENNCANLYKYMFPANLPKPTLAVIGLIQAIGAVMPISEIQSRWFAQLFTGQVKFPEPSEVLKDIADKTKAMADLYVKSRRHTMQTFWIDYMDQIASKIGARPYLWKMMFSDPELALKCYLGPCLPAQYRLQGPGVWSGARAFIVSALSRATAAKYAGHVKTPVLVSGGPSSRQFASHKARLKSSKGPNGKAPSLPPEPGNPGDDVTTGTSGAECVGAQADDVSNGIKRGEGSADSEGRNGKLAGDSRSRDYEISEGQGRFEEDRRWARWSPEWMTFTFYLMVMLICCVAWLLSFLFSQTGNLISLLDRHLFLSE
ncbi:flavin-containing monooxygenase 5 [Aplysia californica]|uniref:Flavin-containing monooxygenase n=1 Tax=Aplysia californica TaxID=6500 RepID=A0ABM0K5A2_APLCA|nr:flavin-containing monooxygenase 5 [Aplysia californica]